MKYVTRINRFNSEWDKRSQTVSRNIILGHAFVTKSAPEWSVQRYSFPVIRWQTSTGYVVACRRDALEPQPDYLALLSVTALFRFGNATA